MNETRLYLASQGYLENVDEEQRAWAIVVICLVFAVLLTGHLLIQRSHRLKSEKRKKRKERTE